MLLDFGCKLALGLAESSTTRLLFALINGDRWCRDEETDQIGFRGWARMAAPIAEYTIIEVRKPNVGENKPADVTADVVIDTSSESTVCFHPSHHRPCCLHTLVVLHCAIHDPCSMLQL